jgi:argininosuccinate synthase
MFLHEAQYFEPVMRNIESFLSASQETVSGKVHVKLLPYRFELIGIESQHDLMNSTFGEYGEMNNAWSSDDVKGFTKISLNATLIHHTVNNLIS